MRLVRRLTQGLFKGKPCLWIGGCQALRISRDDSQAKSGHGKAS